MKIVKGFARVAAIIGAVGCGDSVEGPAEPPREPPIRQIAVVSGNDQTGKAGELLGQPLAVRVTDANGVGVRNVEVAWSVTSGGGRVFHMDPHGSLVPVTATRTGSDGLSEVTFRPTRLGTSSVSATLPGIPSAPVVFTSHASVLVIQNAFWGYFLGPNDSANVTVPVGTTVEWLNHYPHVVHITSISVPPGGASFSARLTQNERFQFVPSASGAWEWTYTNLDPAGEVIGTGDRRTLTAQPDF